MASKKLFALLSILIATFGEGFTTVDGDVGELFNALLERIKSIETANKAKFAEMEAVFRMKQIENEREISSLKLQMNEMKSNFKLKEGRMLQQINDLTTKLIHSCSDGDGNMNDETTRNAEKRDFQGDISALDSGKRRGSSARQYRRVPELEVAFYATHSEHDIHHIGQNQILQFQQTVTNIGNAFNNNTGAFVAPVDGTYVIHATIMGIDIHINGHFSAHFDVNGVVYSKFWVTTNDQSSQMLIIPLRSGDTVSVRGFVGQHYSTFSGFLLYQNYSKQVIVRK